MAFHPYMTARALRAAYARDEIRPSDVIEGALTRIARHDGEIHALLHFDERAVRAEAREWDRRFEAAGAHDILPPLAGVPVVLKDNLCTRGVPTTCGSRILEGWRPPYDATVVERLRRAGAIILGKTNLDEFAMGSSTENSAYGPTRNPWDRARVPGGSSGGSAAAVAAGYAPLALGSDTGGSVRLPAAFCGVVGLKPTYGRVSRYGLVAFASSLDQIGPFALDVADCALILGAIAGHDPRDSTSAGIASRDFLAEVERGARGIRLGVPAEAMGAGVEAPVRQAVRAALQVFESLGLPVEEIALPTLDAALPTYYILAPAEASSNLARYDGVQYGPRAPAVDLYAMYAETRRGGFGPEVKRRIMLGTYALSAGYYEAYYIKAQRVRTLVARDFARAFERVDAVVMPVAPTPAFALGERTDDPLTMYLSDVFTIPVNLAGLPGLAVPCGFDRHLPIGLQLIGRPFDEATLLRAGWAYQQATSWHERRPRLDAVA
jgi:aspartyl-tRNA(Asn)/glutamyl-tRNA(Gln) amidotransferase subunit A